MLISLIEGRALSDAAQVALGLYRQEQADVAAALYRSQNGRALLAKERGAEVDWCARASVYSFVAEMTGDGLVRLQGTR
jgi:phosphosulfolactate phosphohydrolase-like enzyme